MDADPSVVGDIRSKLLTQQQVDAIRSEPSARKKASLRTEYGIRDSPNALLDLPMNFHKYVYPCRSLHAKQCTMWILCMELY